MMDESQRLVYLNQKQWKLIHSLKKKNIFIGGRGSGKSTIGGDYLFRCVDTMPKSTGVICAPTMDILKNRSLPAVQEHWERLGVELDYDYVIGKKPPDDFELPYSKVNDHKNVISFWNGTVIHMVSLYEKNASRGLNLQFCLGDEMAFARRERFTQGILPAMRGHFWKVAEILLEDWEEKPWGQVVQNLENEWVWRLPFQENPHYLSYLLVSSMPYLDDGKWLLKYEDDPDAFYIESTALDNVDVLGPDYVPNLRKELPALEFDVEVMNMRVEQLPDGFYPKFSDEIHTTMDDHYNPDQDLDLSFDFGVFNSMIVAQEISGMACYLDELYVKHGTVDDLVERFCQRYMSHRNKKVNIYGDRNGNNSRPNNQKTLYQEIMDRLRSHGWNPISHVTGLDPAHADKHLMLNQALAGNKRLPAVKLHKVKCKNLIISIKRAPILEGFKKDKRSERQDNPTPQEHATHLSDCFDNHYVKKYRHRFTMRTVSFGEIMLG